MNEHFLRHAEEVIQWCHAIADCSEDQGSITRTYLSPPMHKVHSILSEWMNRLQMTVSVDAVGNLRGVYHAKTKTARRLLIGSHLDTVLHAGAFDGILGVIIGIALVEALERRQLNYAIEVIGFSEEEGVRFGTPFIGSKALTGSITEELLNRTDAQGIKVSDAIRKFGLDPKRISEAKVNNDEAGYIEFHIEQGPVLENLGSPVGVADAIAGQSRWEFTFEGNARHAGTTPMQLRRDALTASAEWINFVERKASAIPNLVATVGKLDVEHGAGNVIPGLVRASLDVRHKEDRVRKKAVEEIRTGAEEIARRRGIHVNSNQNYEQLTVMMDPILTQCLLRAIEKSGLPAHQLTSGAGHDAMIVAEKMPAAMLFLRSPAGISHHPDETVLMGDVASALEVGMNFLEEFEPDNV